MQGEILKVSTTNNVTVDLILGAKMRMGLNNNCQYTIQLIWQSDNMEANDESSLLTGVGC